MGMVRLGQFPRENRVFAPTLPVVERLFNLFQLPRVGIPELPVGSGQHVEGLGESGRGLAGHWAGGTDFLVEAGDLRA